jgi:hypothetical protein
MTLPRRKFRSAWFLYQVLVQGLSVSRCLVWSADSDTSSLTPCAILGSLRSQSSHAAVPSEPLFAQPRGLQESSQPDSFLPTDELPQFRLDLPAFQVFLSPTPYEFDTETLDDLYGKIERTLWKRFETSNLSRNVLFRYLLLSDIRLEQFVNDTSIVSLGTGVVAYLGSEDSIEMETSSANGTQTRKSLLAMIEEAINGQLVETLQSSPLFEFIQVARFVSENNRTDEPTPNEVQTDDGKASASASNVNVGLLSGGIVACAALIALVGLFIYRKRDAAAQIVVVDPDEYNVKQSWKKDEDVATLGSSFDQSPPATPSQESAPPLFPTCDQSLVDESESDAFTVLTEDGDCSVIKSLAEQKSHATGVPLRSIVTTETFERDRVVQVRKDMLTSPWTGRLPSLRNSSTGKSSVSSHLDVTDEEQHRHPQRPGVASSRDLSRHVDLPPEPFVSDSFAQVNEGEEDSTVDALV